MYVVALVMQALHSLGLTVGAVVVYANPARAGLTSFVPLEALWFYVVTNLGFALYTAVVLALMIRRRKAAIVHSVVLNALAVLVLVSWHVLGEKSPVGTVVDSLPNVVGVVYVLRSRRVRRTFHVLSGRGGLTAQGVILTRTLTVPRRLSATLDAMPGSSKSTYVGAPPHRSCWALVAGAPFSRRSWREFGYALVAFPLGIFGFAFVVAVSLVGAALSVIVVGLVLLALSSPVALHLGALNRGLARRFLDEDVAPPPPFQPMPGVVGWVRSGVVDRSAWRARAYLLLKGPFALASFVAVMVLRVGSLWWMLAPAQLAANVGTETVRSNGVTRHYVISFGSFYFDTWQRSMVLTAIGVVGWWLAPWVLRAIFYLDRHLLADLLGPTSLSSRVHHLERARAGAIDEASARLHRLERNLHDGAQAELVGLVMKLGLAQEKLAQADHWSPSEAGQARRLVSDAHERANTALRQLRDLARGIRPPELVDGLQRALLTLAARSPLPTQAIVSLTERPPPAIEEIVYFCAAEFLTNAAKHSEGTTVTLRLAQDGDRLRMTVADDGSGGVEVTGGGFSGLRERLSTVDGRLTVTSPIGGPTVVTVELPVKP